ncbi:hypothetical protein KSF78_0008992 [Schistosoma japonicum]|nr:hypothetical protein KSF78_0008992 [Schistosoma japonicum]
MKRFSINEYNQLWSYTLFNMKMIIHTTLILNNSNYFKPFYLFVYFSLIPFYFNLIKYYIFCFYAYTYIYMFNDFRFDFSSPL